MATKIGPKTVTQRDRSKNLVFCIDAAHADSYGGEPTTNMITTDLSSLSVLDTTITNGGLDGVTNAYVLEDTSSGSYAVSWFVESTNFAASTTYTLSFWLKQDDGATAKCHFRFYDATNSAYMSLEPDTRDGSVVMGTGSPVGYGLLETAADKHGHTWYRFYMTWTTASNLSSSSSHIIQIHPAHDALGGGGSVSNVGSITMWCPQVEAKAYATPCVGGDLAAGASRSASTAVKNISGVGAQGTTLTGTFASYGNTSLRAKRGRKVNLANSAQGHIGGAYWDFDGTDEYISVADTDSLTFTDFAVLFWANPDAFDNNDRVVCKGTTSNGDWMISGGTGGAVRVYAKDGNGNYKDTGTTFSALSPGDWNHVAVVVNRSANKIQFMLNGSGNFQEYSAGNTWDSNFDNSNELRIGLNAAGADEFNGQIACVAIWSSCLTAKEIKDIYIAQKGRFGK